MSAETKPATDRWPKQIKFIVGNEACERFSYYGMRSILAGYITGEVLKGGLGQSVDFSTEIIHLFVFINYFMPLIGAWLSDKLIGRYHTILWVSLFYCAGHGVLACSDLTHTVPGKLACLYTGLALIAFGSGGIKPCVSAFMGDQFKPEQSHLLQKAYGAFYWAINFGSFFSFLVIPWIKNHYSYSYAFAVPGILMGLATFIFWLGSKYYVRIPPTRETRTPGFFAVFGTAMKNYSGFAFAPLVYLMTIVGLPVVAMICMTGISVYGVFSHEMTTAIRAVGWFSLVCVGLWYVAVVVSSLAGRFELPDKFWQSARSRFGEREIAAARSVGPILFVFALIPIFFSLFDQTNSTWVLQGEKMLPYDLFGFKVGAEEMQSMNPLIVMILVPLFTLGIYPHIGKFASPLRRMAAGMYLAAASYLVVAALQKQIEAGAQLSVLWQTIPYVILTAAEVLVSTTGLEFAFREAAPEMKSTIVSFWLVTTAFGDLLVAAITRTLASASNASASVSTGRFMIYAGATFVVAILFSIVATFYKYRDAAAAEGK